MESTPMKSIFACAIGIIWMSSVFGVVTGCDRRTHSEPLSSKRSLLLQVLHLCSPLLRAERASLWPRERHMTLTFRGATFTFFFRTFLSSLRPYGRIGTVGAIRRFHLN